MFFYILKRDLKCKKTSNIIILIFVTLAAMFIASSVNNIICVLRGVDGFFEKAGLDCDYIVVSAVDEDNSVKNVIDGTEGVTAYKEELQLLCENSDFSGNGEKIFDLGKASFFLSVDNVKLNYFDVHNNKITSVNQGEMYVHVNLLEKNGLKAGDTLTVDMNGNRFDFKIAGAMKDALLGSSMLPYYRFIINDDDYMRLCSAAENVGERNFGIYYIYSYDPVALEEKISDEKGVQFDVPIDTVRSCYVMNKVVAALLLIVSVGPIFISFSVLWFAISSTISEEIREIGAMKAIGISDKVIRKLYIIKYLAITVSGAAIGAAASIPFGKLLLNIISKEMALDNDNTILITLICTLTLIGITMLFCYFCTRNIDSLSAVDALRSGQNGERFRRKSILSLEKTRLGTAGFLAANDCLSAPKQFGLITFIITLGLLPVMILANTVNTLCSDKLIHLFCATRSDVYIADSERSMDVIKGNDEGGLRNAREIERILADNGMPCKCHVEVYYKYSIKANNKQFVMEFMQCKETKASDYVYTEGVPPENKNEIAIASRGAELLGVDIGDTVMIEVDGEDKPFVVTAFFSSLKRYQFGKIGRFNEDMPTSIENSHGTMAFQVDFDDHPDKKEIAERIDRIKEIFKNDNVFDAEGYSKDCTRVADVTSALKRLIFVFSVIATMLITVLMELLFVSKEKGETALMKALGFSSGTIIANHVLRFVMVSVLAAIISSALCLPMTGLVMDPLFSLMGSTTHIDYKLVPWEIFGLYPAAIIIITAVSAFITSLSTISIKASQTSDIE